MPRAPDTPPRRPGSSSAGASDDVDARERFERLQQVPSRGERDLALRLVADDLEHHLPGQT